MSQLSKAVRREIGAHEQLMQGVVISDRRMEQVDDSAGGAWSWVCDVDIGENRYLESIIIHAVNGSRSYAREGMSITLVRGHAGKFEIVGPGDMVTDTLEITYYDLDGTETGGENLGYTFERMSLEFYDGPTPGVPGTGLWNSLLYPWNYVRIIDGDGNPVS